MSIWNMLGTNDISNDQVFEWAEAWLVATFLGMTHAWSAANALPELSTN